MAQRHRVLEQRPSVRWEALGKHSSSQVRVLYPPWYDTLSALVVKYSMFGVFGEVSRFQNELLPLDDSYVQQVQTFRAEIVTTLKKRSWGSS